MSLSKLNTFLLNASNEEKLAFFSFDTESPEKILIKFDRWARMYYPRYFTQPTADFHYDMVMGYISSYTERTPFINLGFRGCAKSSLAKLFITYVMLNDLQSRKKFIKFLTKDLRNSKQMVTDIFNNIVQVKELYGEVFIIDKEVKQEETMSTFQLNTGVKIAAGTVGQQHRGHLQDAYRPDWLWFDDTEDKESVRSITITQGIIGRCDEALAGMAIDGSYVVLGNYISKNGTMQWFINKGIPKLITPLLLEDGTITWPEAFSQEAIEKIKINTDDFYGEYLCVKPDTPILTPNGARPIETIKVGDTVITHMNREQKVLKVFTHQAQDLLDITVEGKTTTITKNHPVLTERGWVPAGELTLDDIVVIPHGILQA